MHLVANIEVSSIYCTLLEIENIVEKKQISMIVDCICDIETGEN